MILVFIWTVHILPDLFAMQNTENTASCLLSLIVFSTSYQCNHHIHWANPTQSSHHWMAGLFPITQWQLHLTLLCLQPFYVWGSVLEMNLRSEISETKNMIIFEMTVHIFTSLIYVSTYIFSGMCENTSCPSSGYYYWF